MTGRHSSPLIIEDKVLRAVAGTVTRPRHAMPARPVVVGPPAALTRAERLHRTAAWLLWVTFGLLVGCAVSFTTPFFTAFAVLGLIAAVAACFCLYGEWTES